jgi:hypothetical protein
MSVAEARQGLGRVQYSASVAKVDAHRPPLHRSLTQSLSAVQVVPIPSSGAHTAFLQRAPVRQSPAHGSPGPGSATQMPPEHPLVNASQT